MKILIVNRALGTLFGGGETTDLNAARYLMKRGHDVTMITGRPIFGQPKNKFDGVSVLYVKAPELRKYAYGVERVSSLISAAFYHLDKYFFELAVLRWLRRQPERAFDVIQMCSLFNLPAKLMAESNYPCVSWLPGPPSRLTRRKIKNIVHHRKFAIFTRGAPEATLLDMGLHKGREYEIIEPGVELDTIDNTPGLDVVEAKARLGLLKSDLLGVTNARLVPIKNHALLLDAIALANSMGVQWNWAFAGDGPLDAELRNRARALGIERQIRWLGHQKKADVYRLLKSCDLFALTSVYENFSNAVLEAMALRIPVIGTEVGYLQHLIRESGAGIVVPSCDVKMLAEALVHMSDPNARSGYGICGRAFSEQFNWPLIAEKLEKLYLKVINA